MGAHKHQWTGLYWHFGPYGRQDVHVHSCFRQSCNAAVIGEGVNCTKDGWHKQVVLSASGRKKWWDADPDAPVRTLRNHAPVLVRHELLKALEAARKWSEIEWDHAIVVHPHHRCISECAVCELIHGPVPGREVEYGMAEA